MYRVALSLCLSVLAWTPAMATQLHCTALQACMGTTCRDAAGMAMDFGVTYDTEIASVTFNDPTLPTTETLEFRGMSEGAPAYFYSEPDLMVAVQIFEAETLPRVRVAFGSPDAPGDASQLFARCAVPGAS